jgi:hypothetical protein
VDDWTVEAAFSLVGNDFDPAEVTRRLGIEPTMAWRTGEPRPTVRVPYKFSRWLWAAPLVSDGDIEDEVLRVLERFEPFAGVIADLRDQLAISTTEIKVVHKMRGEYTPYGGGFVYPGLGVGLRHATMRRLAVLELDLDIDQYTHEDDDQAEVTALTGAAI